CRSRTPGVPSATGRSLALEVAMNDRRRVPEAGQKPAELLRERDRAVAPAGAADRDGEIGLPFPLVAGQDELQEVLETAEHLLAFWMIQHEGPHVLVAAVERAQRFDEVRVGQEPDVEHQIGVERYTVLESERDQRGGQARTGFRRDVELDEPILELMDRQRRGVEDPVGDLTQVRERLALGADPVE